MCVLNLYVCICAITSSCVYIYLYIDVQYTPDISDRLKNFGLSENRIKRRAKFQNAIWSRVWNNESRAWNLSNWENSNDFQQYFHNISINYFALSWSKGNLNFLKQTFPTKTAVSSFMGKSSWYGAFCLCFLWRSLCRDKFAVHCEIVGEYRKIHVMKIGKPHLVTIW